MPPPLTKCAAHNKHTTTMQSDATSVKRGRPADTYSFPSAKGPTWAATLADARNKWSPATDIAQKLGRPPKAAKYPRTCTQQQRVFASGIIHSVDLYDCLKPHAQEDKAMLVARGPIDESRDVPSSVGTGARPPADVNTDVACLRPDAGLGWGVASGTHVLLCTCFSII